MSSIEVQAKLFVRLLRYYHKRPLFQSDVPMGVASVALHSLLVGGTALTFAERGMLPMEGKYDITRYSSCYCLNCNWGYDITVFIRNPFTTACVSCNNDGSTSGIKRVDRIPINSSTGKLDGYNPCVVLFEELDTTLQRAVLDLLV